MKKLKEAFMKFPQKFQNKEHFENIFQALQTFFEYFHKYMEYFLGKVTRRSQEQEQEQFIQLDISKLNKHRKRTFLIK